MKRFAVVALALFASACRADSPKVEARILPILDHQDLPSRPPTPDPFVLSVEPDVLLISSSGTATLKIVAARRADFDRPIDVEIHGLPEHFTAPHLVLEGDQSEGEIVVSADPEMLPPVTTHLEVFAQTEGFSRFATVLLRFPIRRPHGIADASFGDNGRVLFPTEVADVQDYPDGRLLIIDRDQICRVLLDGSPDLTFGPGSGGCTTAAAPGVTFMRIRITPSGILALGWFAGIRPSGGYPAGDIFLEKLSLDGIVDTSFGSDGWARFDLTLYEWPDAILVTHDDRIVISDFGKVEGAWPDQWEALLLRLNPDGSRDSSFGADGVAALLSEVPMHIADVVEMPDGRLLANSGKLLVFTRSGEVDPAFHSDVTGVFNSEMRSDLFLQRYSMSVGVLSSSGEYSELLPPLQDSPVRMRNFVQDLDGGFVSTGSAAFIYDDYSDAVARRLPNGELDPEFGTNGALGFYRYEFRVKLLASGQILLYGIEGGSREDEYPVKRWYGFVMRMN